MPVFRWPLVCAAAFIATLGIASAQAQTVIVQHAPAGSTVELVFNADTVGTASVAGPNATVTTDVLAKRGTAETTAYVFVDGCPNMTRVLLVEAGVPPPAQGSGCDRRQLTGLYAVRKATTFVIDVAPNPPAMWLTQGPAPSSWLGEDVAGVSRGRSWDSPPVKLVLFAGGSMARFTNATSTACGNVSTCSSDDTVLGYRAGASFWIKPFVAVEASYAKPRRLTANGSGTGFSFTSTRETELATISGVFGVPVGRARLFAQAGANYHRARTTTSQTIDVSGSQTAILATSGWGWLFGGGGELWLTRVLGLYGELGLARLKGKAVKGGEGIMDDHALLLVVGARVHIGR
jgi:hypothetical protein